MIRTEIADDLRQQISWIEDIDGHKFPGWLNVTNAMRRAVVYLYPLPVLVTDKSDQCPRCGRQLAKRYQTNYCPKCGQAVEWPTRTDGS